MYLFYPRGWSEGGGVVGVWVFFCGQVCAFALLMGESNIVTAVLPCSKAISNDGERLIAGGMCG